MHGRIKTISTEEQKVKLKKAKEVKAQLYKEGMGRIFFKRSQNEYDDEALNLTHELLVGNPDIITLWNFRREIFLFKKETLECVEFDNILKADLNLTEICLRVNPKSYGTWHHRIWLLDNINENLWSKEIDICSKYLSMDERNFHCWQYRNIVAEKAKIPPANEYEYTTEKIEKNFSNYSAWHYRSKLLPQIFEDPQGLFPIAENKHKSELEIVQNAAFTDPDDQSAWFYLRWLLNLRRPPITIISAYINENSLIVAFSRDVPPKTDVIVEVNGIQALGNWIPLSKATAAIWKFTPEAILPQDGNVEICLPSTGSFEGSNKVKLARTEPFTSQPFFNPTYSSGLIEAFEDQLRNCEELLSLEPDSKWTLLTSVFAMKSLDLPSYQSKIVNTLKTLIEVDPFRVGYYNDLRSQIEIEVEIIRNPFPKSFQLENKNLTCVYHLQYFNLCETIDFKCNSLNETHLMHFQYFVSCKTLNLSNNMFHSLEHLPILNNLENLVFSNNPILDIDKQYVYLKTFPKLKSIIF